LSISNTAQNYETCLFWRRVGTLGWGTFFSFLLHFIVIITEKADILKKKWIYILIYLPAALNVFVFGLYEKIAVKQYNLIETSSGWVNVCCNTFWNWMLYAYDLSFFLVGFTLLVRWAVKLEEGDKKSKAYLICLLFA